MITFVFVLNSLIGCLCTIWMSRDKKEATTACDWLPSSLWYGDRIMNKDDDYSGDILSSY